MASICNQRRPMVLAVVLLLVAFAGMCQGKTLPEARELVDRYREAITCWNQRVSMRIHSQIDVTPVDPDRPSRSHQRLNLIHRRDGNRAEWLGSKSFFEDDKVEVSTSSRKFAAIANGEHIVAADDAWTPDETYKGTIRRRNYGKILRSASDDYYYGGFLDGLFLGLRKTANMAERLSQSDMLRVVGKEDINETVCYIVEAKTEYGTVTVWIAPEKGYNTLKATIDSSTAPWSIVIDSIEVQKINGIFVPVAGRFVQTHKMKDGVETVHAKVKRSQIDLNPDFEALGAFRLPLPDGSHIYDRDSGISYQVFGGELVPNVDEAVIEQIDRITENITAKDILQKTLETVTSRPPMMADGELHCKWDYSDRGITERKFVSRVYIRNQEHDFTRDSWKLKDGKWDKTSEIRAIWDGSRRTVRERKMPFYTESGDLLPGDFFVVYDDKPKGVGWGMGGADGLFGTTGDEHFAKLLLESETLHLRPEMEQIDGFDCYVVEGDTPSYYHTVWIDPQNGYLHRKIICEGYQKNLPYRGSWIVKYGIEVTDVKIEYFEGIPVVTEAKRHFFNERADGNTLDAIAQEKMSNVVCNPDFESMGAFKMDKVPNGTPVVYWVNDLHKTGVKFHWQDGRIVPNVDEEVIEQIDRISEQIMAEGQVPPGLATVRKPEAAPNEPATPSDTQPKTQVDTVKTQPEVVAEADSLTIVLVILIGLLIIGVIGWLMFRRIKA